VGRLLGHGQFGYTFAAVDRLSGDRVAVKRIDKAKMTRPVAVEDVKREVKILKALKGHENIVHFDNAFEDDSYVYIVMELCEGGELLDRILAKKNSRYSEKDAAVVVRQMLKVAAECHLRGLVHRDMKPENFLFKSTKEDSPLKATDFGLSDFIKPGKKFRDIVGSAYYVAPEVLKRRSGPESDVWSIGVITYILLCGRRPFWDKTEDGIFKEVLRNKPDFRKRPWPSISSSAKDFVKKLLVKNPRARLTAAQALSHPWVREGGDASEIPVDISVLYNMRQFVKYSRFKQFALRALASTVNEEELADLKDQFDAIDVDKSGSISIEEMRHALAKDLPWRLKGPRVLEIIQAVSFERLLFGLPFISQQAVDITSTHLILYGRSTATRMALSTSKSLLRQLSTYIRWLSWTLKGGASAAKLLSANLIWMGMGTSPPMNLECTRA
uniref:non-specific serine/threonine protein kinase n=1 Tax=Aegilops tauschii subsp. strangulata TaxID=200361 RepID=A0A453N4J7_AEGTS